MPCYIISILIVVIYLPLSFSACSYSSLPGFKLNLKCRNGSVQIDIGSETYAVLNGSQTLRISRNMSQASHTICSSEYGNNSSSPSKKCNPNMEARNINSFSCTSESIFSDTSKNYTWVHPTIQTRVPDFSRCSVTIIPIQEHILKDIDEFSQTLEDVKFSGFSDLNFSVSYFLNATSCYTCLRSQPPCGLPWRNHTCYCKDGMYRMDNCPAPAPLQLPGPAPAPSQLPGPAPAPSQLPGSAPAPLQLPGSAPAPLKIPGRNRNDGADAQKKLGTGTDLPKKLGLGLGAGGLSIFLTVVGVICYHKGCLSFTSKISWRRDTKDQRLVEIFVKNYGSMAPKRYSYSDIKKITNSFKDKIGQGGYGDVYKGKVAMGRLVAVKLLNKAKGNGEDFINEVASISTTSHVNIVSLLGFCFDGSKRALVYEFMVNGSLEKFIYDHNTLERQSHLGWDVLYKIAVGVARGLEYLHRGCNNLILHLDIKPHNILLDQDFNPKISDFGLAKLYPRDESIASMLNGRGTPGYTAPEMINRNFGRVSHKADVYSYGMMVLEMVGKRKNLNVGADHTSEIYFPQWIYKRLELDEDLVMHGVVSEEDEEIAKKMILVALWCIQSNPMDRPEMSRVEEMLEGKLDLLSIPPKPYLCSPPRSPPAGLPRHD